MRIIEIAALANGAHRNQDGATVCPDGWAVVPDALAIPDTYPFVAVGAVDGVVTKMAAGTMPAPIPVKPEPDPLATLAEAVADIMYTMDKNSIGG